MLLSNIGDARMSVGELTSRGCYLGSNVSYNVKNLVENGYLAHERSAHDRRTVYVRLTDKGCALRDRLNDMHGSHIGMLGQTRITDADLEAPTRTVLDRRQQPHPAIGPSRRLIGYRASDTRANREGLLEGSSGSGCWKSHLP
jgi:DNA-binding MarR family transcriptional regulator